MPSIVYVWPLDCHFETYTLPVSRYFLLVIFKSFKSHMDIFYILHNYRNEDSDWLGNLPKIRNWKRQNLNPGPL